MFLKVLLAILKMFIEQILKKDPAKMTVAELFKHAETPRFKAFYQKHQ